MPLGVLSVGAGDDGLGVSFFEELPIDKDDFCFVITGATSSAAAPLSAVATWSFGTCHVARCLVCFHIKS